jgi:dTDP-4-amino-4,6-dideoxygalactose transaminase
MFMANVKDESFLNLNCSSEQLRRYPKFLGNISAFLSEDSGAIKSWPLILETALARMTGFRGAVAVQSFADTVKLGLELTGIKPGMEIVVPETAPTSVLKGIKKLGAIPLFARCKKNLSIDTEDLADLLTSDTSAIFNFSYCGVPNNSTLLQKFAKSFNLRLIEGANFLPLPGLNFSPTMVNTDALVLSLSPLSVVRGLTDFGVLLLNDEKAIFDITTGLRINNRNNYIPDCITSFNRLDGANAAAACSLLEHSQRTTKRRIRNANYYQKSLQDTQLLWDFEKDQLDFNSADYFIVDTPQPDSLAQHLKCKKINSLRWAQVLLNVEPPEPENFKYNNISETKTKLGLETLAIPCHDYLSREQLDLIIESLKGWPLSNG